MLSSKPDAFSQNKPSQVGKYVPARSVSVDAVRNGSTSKKRPPTVFSPGDESRRRREGTATPQNAEIRTLEQRVFQDTFDPTKGLDHVRPVVVQVPELAVVALVRPPACVLRVMSRRGPNRPGIEKKNTHDLI